MATVFQKVAAYLAYMNKSSENLDCSPLFPNDFLASSEHLDLTTTQITPSIFTARYNKLNKILDHFWDRLVRELSTQLRHHSKWATTKRDVQVGDIAILLDRKVRNQRKVARVTDTVKATDGMVRRVTLFDGKKYLQRGIDNVIIIHKII